MSVVRLHAAQHFTQPWKNGLGSSSVIAVFPQGEGFDTLLWQASKSRRRIG
ncbi:MAG: HutD family protein [Betaproteobacteria bacterium]|nr:HutD family protein [Betaproteobacteria bacterium]